MARRRVQPDQRPPQRGEIAARAAAEIDRRSTGEATVGKGRRFLAQAGWAAVGPFLGAGFIDVSGLVVHIP